MTDRPIIPFVSNISAASLNAWSVQLQAALPDFLIVPFDPNVDFANAELALVANPDPDHLSQLPHLRWVQSLWAGVENLVHSLPDDVAIVRMTDPQLAKTMAEAVLTMTLYLHRDLPKYVSQQASCIWEQHDVVLPEDRKVGVLGLGALGRSSCAALAQHGFDVMGWSRSPKSIPNVRCFSGEDGLTDLLHVSDIVVVLLPLTTTTRGLLDRSRLSRMKSGASVINFARAQIIETDALLNMLAARHLNHAVLDVFAVEPLPQTDRLWRTDNLTILPHVSAPTNMKTASEVAAKNIATYFRTGQVPDCVDRQRGY